MKLFQVARATILGHLMPTLLTSLEECGGSVVECLTRGQGVAGSSLSGGTALCP